MQTKAAVVALLLANTQAKTAPVKSTELELIVGGILKGALDAEGFTDITQCINDAEGVFADTKIAIEDFQKGDVSSVIAGVKEIGDILKLVKAGMSDCSHLKADWAKLEAMAAIFASPSAFAYHVGKDLLINGRDIYHEISTAITDYKAGQWEEFGVNIGEAAAKVIIGEDERKAIKDATKLELIVGGLLKGALDAEGFDDINSCIADAEGVFADVQVAIQDFEAGDIEHTIEGVKEIAAILELVKAGMSDCSHLKADWAKLEAMAAIFASPSSFAYHVGKDLLINGRDIYHEINTSITDYKTEQWEDFGVQIGEAAAKVILGEESQKQLAAIEAKKAEETTKLIQIVTGILKGAIDAEGFNDINTCIADAEEVFGDAETVYADFQQGGVSGAIAGVKEIGVMLQAIHKAMSDCTATKADWAKLAQLIAIFKSPTSFAFHVGKDLIINGRDIYHEIRAAIADYEAQNWEDFGIQIGEAAAKTLIGEEKPTTNNKAKVAQVLQGMIEQFGGKFNLDALLMCIEEEDKGALILDAAYNEFVIAYKQQSISDLLGGIIAVVAGVKQIQAGIPTCKAIDTTSWDYAGFKSSTSLMSDPINNFAVLADDLMIHGVSILKNSNLATVAYQKGDFHTFGQEMGKVLKLATAHKETIEAPRRSNYATMTNDHVIPSQNAAQIVQGFLAATNVGTFNFTDLLMCIYDADQAAMVLDQAAKMLYDSFQTKNAQEAVEGLVATVAFVKALQQSIPVCKSVVTTKMNWGTFDQIVSVLESPQKHMQIVAENIVFNGKTITKEIDSSLNAFNQKKWLEFGTQFGSVLRDTTLASDALFLY